MIECSVSKLSVVSTVEWLGGVCTSWGSPAWGHCGGGPECPAWGTGEGMLCFWGTSSGDGWGMGNVVSPLESPCGFGRGVLRELLGGHRAGAAGRGAGRNDGGGIWRGPAGGSVPARIPHIPSPPPTQRPAPAPRVNAARGWAEAGAWWACVGLAAHAGPPVRTWLQRECMSPPECGQGFSCQSLFRCPLTRPPPGLGLRI